jgi:replication factor C subunit 3/5
MISIKNSKPKSLDDIYFHKDISNKLKKIIKSKNIPHMLVYGPKHSGKYTLIKSALLDIYKEKKINLRNEKIDIKISNTTNKHSIDVIKSNYFIIFHLINNIPYDKYIIQEFTNYFTESISLDSFVDDFFYRIILINKAEYISKKAQAFLRRTMEKYSNYCRFIIITTQISNIINPIKSRCFLLRIPAFDDKLVKSFVNEKIKKNNMIIDNRILADIFKYYKNDIYLILTILEGFCQNKKYEEIDWNIILPTWNRTISWISDIVFNNITINDIINIRNSLYKILVNNIIPNDILKLIVDLFLYKTNKYNFIKKEDKNKIKTQIMKSATNYQCLMCSGNKSMFYLEAFIIDISNLIIDYKKTNNISII